MSVVQDIRLNTMSPWPYDAYHSYMTSAIPTNTERYVLIDPEDIRLLEDVWETYGDSTGNALEALSHRELPWMEARRGYEPAERCTVVISPHTMASYYKSIHCGD